MYIGVRFCLDIQAEERVDRKSSMIYSPVYQKLLFHKWSSSNRFILW